MFCFTFTLFQVFEACSLHNAVAMPWDHLMFIFFICSIEVMLTVTFAQMLCF